jgi:hypothetical protein
MMLPHMNPPVPWSHQLKGYNKECYPAEVFDTSPYRKYWSAGAKHFDHDRREAKNKRRFLLMGRPQIGKTGAFLHLVYLLWKTINPKSALPPPEPVPVPEPLPPEPLPDPNPKVNMDVYPSFELMQKEKFADTLPGDCPHIEGPPASGCSKCPPAYGLYTFIITLGRWS